MKKILMVVCVAMVLNGCSGCGSENRRWKSLPQGVYLNYDGINEDELDLVLSRSINFWNRQLGMEVFYMTDDSNAPIKVHLEYKRKIIKENKIGRAIINYGFDEIIDSANVYVLSRGRSPGSHSNMIHELWHTLGFLGHIDDEKCIITTINNKNFYPPLCSQMIDLFNDRYPEYKINNEDIKIESQNVSNNFMILRWKSNQFYQIEFEGVVKKIIYPPNKERPKGSSYIYCDLTDYKIFNNLNEDVTDSLYPEFEWDIKQECRESATFN